MTDLLYPPRTGAVPLLDDDIAEQLATGLFDLLPPLPVPQEPVAVPPVPEALAPKPPVPEALAPKPLVPEALAPKPLVPEVVPKASLSDAVREPEDELELELEPEPPKTHRLLLVLVGLLTMALRVVNLGVVGLNSDEAVYAGQGGALLGVGNLDQHFSIFRAHPLLLQFVVGGWFQITGQSDVGARLVIAVLFGAGSVLVSYRLARELYGPEVAIAAAAVLAVLPYHVIVSRQVLVDTPMGFFAVLAVHFAVKATTRDDRRWLYAAFFTCGLAALSKEIAVLLLPVLALWLVTGPARIPIRRLVGPTMLFAGLGLPFPLTRLISQPENASQFFLWQLTRAPNHTPDYFARVLLQFGGVAFLPLLLVGLGVLFTRRNSADQLLLWWMAIFGLFFQFWPTKLFPYLFVILPALVMTIVVGIQWLATRLRSISFHAGRAFGLAVVVLVGTLTVGSGEIVLAGPTAELEGFGDFDIEVQTFAGSREFGEWAEENTPANSRFVTIGPSLGNILRFYGSRDSVALSVSPDPAKRNPAYVPVANPDLAARQMAVHYIVWDAYSADRSAFYNGRLRALARKHGGEIVFSVYAVGDQMEVVEGAPPPGSDIRIVVWDVPGAGSTIGGNRTDGLS